MIDKLFEAMKILKEVSAELKSAESLRLKENTRAEVEEARKLSDNTLSAASALLAVVAKW